ncbi:MAG: type II toxin-antitoxin system VapC family toxin [Niveispirillum sp.]|nr:type II toxin-antitoxin system VapC family toxin [Niveispirillum sp.]
MENDVVLDSSAVLALLKAERGADQVAQALPGALVSTVNLAEIVSKLHEDGWPTAFISDVIERLDLRVISFSVEQAKTAGIMRISTKRLGLSLGDRACLALAKERHAAVLTADGAWCQLASDLGLRITNIRQPI